MLSDRDEGVSRQFLLDILEVGIPDSFPFKLSGIGAQIRPTNLFSVNTYFSKMNYSEPTWSSTIYRCSLGGESRHEMMNHFTPISPILWPF